MTLEQLEAAQILPPPRFTPEELADLLGQHRPTAEQSAVISAPLQPMLVIAGAGSGKTATMADRVVWLVANGWVRPEQILGMTFTRKAAGELAARIRVQLARLARFNLPAAGTEAEAADAAADQLEPTVSTYHSYANSLVSDYGLRLGIERDVVLLGTAQSWQLASRIVEAYDGEAEHIDAAKSTLVNAVVQLAGECAEHLRSPEEVLEHLRAEVERTAALPYVQGSSKAARQEVHKLLNRLRTRMTLAGMVRAYADAKHERGVLDYGDLVALAARIARTVPAARELERQRFKVVLLDEFQDTSHAQMVLFSELFGDGHPVTAVGDPNQSIYGFRGASAGQLFRFPEEFPAVEEGVRAPAPVTFLTTAWRNTENVLAMANTISARLNRRDPNRPDPRHIDVPPLQPRPGAADGLVRLARYASEAEEAAAIAGMIRASRVASPRSDGTVELPSVALLCRRRAQMPLLAEQLEQHGIPYEIVGLGGLLDTPEIVDLVATLRVIADPTRSDALMRLLAGARWRLGPADLMAFADWSAWLMRRREQAAQSRSPLDLDADEEASTAAPSVVEQDVVDAASLVEALDRLPQPGWTSRHGRSLTGEGLDRLQRLGQEIHQLRTFAGDDLTTLIGEVERAMLLDIEVAAKPGVSIHQARRHLDAFLDAAATFSQTAPRVDLLAFLSWLEAVAAQENGLDIVQTEVRRDAVQLLTVHASKGLEWDVVFVPGLNGGAFPSANDSRWTSGHETLPWPLRGDRSDLPQWDTDQPDQKSWLDAEDDFAGRVREHAEEEERRLAYVAFTRAKDVLVCSSAAWVGTRSKPADSSPFLTELLPHAEGTAPRAHVLTWTDDDEAGTENPMRESIEEARWPFDPLEGPVVCRAGASLPPRGAGRRAVVEAAAASVLELLPGNGEPPVGPALTLRGRNWDREAEKLLERHNRTRSGSDVELPAHISASLLVELAADAADVTRRLRRPVPREPGMAARRGTAFHSWVEDFYGTTGMLDLEEYPGAGEPFAGADEDLGQMTRNFRNSAWADRAPAFVEVPVETRVDAVVVRGRIDAVFQDADGGWELVDWKTGAVPPKDKLAVRALQLAVYRLAWARLRGVPLDKVRAAFYYVQSDTVVRPHDLAGEAELERIVSAALG